MKNFYQLSRQIAAIDVALKSEAAKAVNRLLTLRNWLIGYYLVTYEQQGEDRAQYGDRLIRSLAEKLETDGLIGFSFTNLNLYRQFYLAYPHIIQTLSEFSEWKIIQTPSEQLNDGEAQQGVSATDDTNVPILGTASQEFKPTDLLPNLGAASQELEDVHRVKPATLISKLSFSHFVELIKLDSDAKRAFYEGECIRGTWSVRELKRQIASLLYERTGLSKDKKAVTSQAQKGAETNTLQNLIRTPYVFEFLGLPQKDLVKESDLEQAIMDHLTDFILELGNGFCFEARQKRILIGDEYYFIDLVFYHRILKCHVLIELKVDAFNHAHAAQLNTYLNFYKAEVQQPGDNPPVGILLCTGQNETLVQYATAGMDQTLFVQQYSVLLPSEDELKAFIEKETDQLKQTEL